MESLSCTEEAEARMLDVAGQFTPVMPLWLTGGHPRLPLSFMLDARHRVTQNKRMDNMVCMGVVG
jgi:hypothetical protein